jgi:hypothetical protein
MELDELPAAEGWPLLADVAPPELFDCEAPLASLAEPPAAADMPCPASVPPVGAPSADPAGPLPPA